jgi:hypothetical protein
MWGSLASMDVDKKRFRKMFPHLTEEVDGKASRIEIAGVRLNAKPDKRAASSIFYGYEPNVIDFLRRCDNEEQAREIIKYLERKREITPSYAAKLRKQLREKGVRSFGTKKDEDYYLRKAGL